MNVGLSENITGVTFLALGNGAPDLFSSFTAIQQDSFSLAMGELMGAASFIVTCVVGMLAITTGFRVNRRPFLRDVLFFIGAIVTLLIVLADGRIKLFESILLIVYYVFYVGVVGVGRYL
jgi:sodium/potassium/calcium exchanger 6